MTHVFRFYAEEFTPESGTVELSPEEGHHALHVARCKVGDAVVLFDGRGHEWAASIETSTRTGMKVRIESLRTVGRPESEVVLVQAYLNHEKALDETVRRCTELGVSRFSFFRGERSERISRHEEKWKRLAVESCKQCGRAWLPVFDKHDSLASAMASLEGYKVLIATDSRSPSPLETELAGHKRVAVIVGPEGGLSGGEVEEALGAGAVPVSLGSSVLRSELAGPVACTLILYVCGRLGPLPRARGNV